MKILALACAALAVGLFAAAPAKADGGAAQYRWVAACDGTYGPLTKAGPSVVTYNPAGEVCTAAAFTGTFSASISGFTAAAVGTPLTATTGGATGTLPAGEVVVASNVGTANTAYCALGGTATTAWQPITPNGGWFAFTVGASTQLSCITTASTTTINMVGGAGLPTGTGGGGGGSGSSSAIISWGGGTLGAMANYGTSPGAVLVPGTNSFVTNAAAVGPAGTASPDVVTVQGVASMTPLLATTQAGSVMAITSWGGGTIGAMANYGTSPGAVLVPGVNANVTNGAAAGAAGSASTDVLTIQGIASMTPIAITNDAGANLAKETGGNLDAILTAVTSAIPAGSATIGGVIAGGTTVEVCAGLTTTNGTYAANTNIGGKITLASLFGAKGSGVIQSVRVDFKTAQTVEMDLYPFSGDPSSSTWTDNSANAINAADVYKVEPPIVMATAKSGLGTHTVYYAAGVGQSIAMGAAVTSGYFILSPTATTATLGSTSGAQVCVTVLRDDP